MIGTGTPERRGVFRLRWLGFLALPILAAAPVSAFDAQQFAPGVDPYPYFSVVSSKTSPAGRFHASIWYNYAEPTLRVRARDAAGLSPAAPSLLGPILDPLLRPITEPVGEGAMPLRPITDPVLCALRPLTDPTVAPTLDPLFDCPAGASASGLVTVVERIHYANFVATYSVTDWFEVGLDIPFSYIDSDTPGADEGLDIDDIRLLGKFQLGDVVPDGFGLALSPFVDIPVGDEDHLTSNGTADYGLIGIVEAATGRFRSSLNWGYRVNDEPFDDDDETDEILFGLGLGFLVLGDPPVFQPGSTRLELLAEIFGATAERNPFDEEFTTPAEFLLGGRFFHASGLLVAAGAGRRITESINGPDWRVVAQAGYAWQPPPPPPPAEPPPPPPPPPQPDVVVTDEQIVTLEPIHFDFDKSTIKPVSYPILDQVMQVMRERPEIEVRIEGHTDSIGTDRYNQGLSERRARAVLKYLVDRGIDASRLGAIGYGESRPIATNDTAEGRARNRRTEFHIVGRNGGGGTAAPPPGGP